MSVVFPGSLKMKRWCLLAAFQYTARPLSKIFNLKNLFNFMEFLIDLTTQKCVFFLFTHYNYSFVLSFYTTQMQFSSIKRHNRKITLKTSTPSNVIYLHYSVCLKHFTWEQSVIKSTSIHLTLELCHNFQFRVLAPQEEK